jgi:glycosyltransferase involved in cell wall biosynthesis
VYSRRDVPTSSIEGLQSIPVRSIGGKHFENLSRSALATLRALRRYDVVHYHAIGPGVFSIFSACAGQRSVVTLHALDYDRDKWGRAAKAALKVAEQTSAFCADQITAVAPSMVRHFAEKYHRAITFIPNGVNVRTPRPPGSALGALGLTPGYLLFASRLTPEKGCDELIEAFNQVRTTRRLVIAGEAQDPAYFAKLQSMANPTKIKFVGHRKGEVLSELFSNAYLHVLPSHLEGWSLAISEALGYHVPTLASDIDQNRDVMGDSGFYFRSGDVEDLRRELVRLIARPEIVARMAASFASLEMASWDEVAENYLRLYQKKHVALPSQPSS